MSCGVWIGWPLVVAAAAVVAKHGDGDRGARTRQVPGLCLLCLAGSMLLE